MRSGTEVDRTHVGLRACIACASAPTDRQVPTCFSRAARLDERSWWEEVVAEFAISLSAGASVGHRCSGERSPGFLEPARRRIMAAKKKGARKKGGRKKGAAKKATKKRAKRGTRKK